MHIDQVVLTGYRCHLPDAITLNPYTCIIGRNDTGKSCMLRALRLLFDVRVNPVLQDLTTIDPVPKEAYVSARLVNVPATWPIGDNGTLEIRRRVAGGSSIWEVKGLVAISQALRKMSVGPVTKKEIESDPGITADIKAILDKELPPGHLRPEDCKAAYLKLDEKGLVAKEMDWGPVDKELIGSLFHPVYLSADSKAEDEASGSRSTFNDLGGMLVRESARTNEELNAKIEEVRTLLGAVTTRTDDGKWTFEPLNRMETILKEEVGRFDPSVQIMPKPTTPTIGQLQYGMDLDVKDKHIDGLANMGHGLRRSVIFAMLRTLARMPEIIGPVANDPESPPPFRLFLIEEPELYLHPQAERARMFELKELSDRPQTQVVLCTHSAFFVDMQGYQNILRFAREDRGVSRVFSWSGATLNSGEKEWLKMVRYFDASGSAMLFADYVILCEGATEKVCIPAIADILGFGNPGYEVVDCKGAGNLETYQKVLEALGVPYAIWIDGDGNDAYKKTQADAKVVKLSASLTPGVGHLIVTKVDWEVLAEIPGGSKEEKPNRSRKKFLDDQTPVPALLEAAIRAAYDHRSLDMR